MRKNQYAVKVIDGGLKGGSSEPIGAGTYKTSVNVHNPQQWQVDVDVKMVISGANFKGKGEITTWLPCVLRDDGSMEFDREGFNFLCASSNPRITPPAFIEGWLVFECIVDYELDVWGIYTGNVFPGVANKAGPLATMHMEQAIKRIVEMEAKEDEKPRPRK